MPSLWKRPAPDVSPALAHYGIYRTPRYVAEFDFRYNNRVKLGLDDAARTVAALRGVVGKRLTYRAGVAKA